MDIILSLEETDFLSSASPKHYWHTLDTKSNTCSQH